MGQHFFINAYFIEKYRYIVSRHFSICLFELPPSFPQTEIIKILTEK